MTPRPHCDIWVSSCVKDGGAYRYRLDFDTERLTLAQKIPMPSPMWLELRGETLWAILRAPFSQSGDSAVASFHTSTGKMLTQPISTQGTVACHMAIEGDDVYAANYVTGSLIKLPDRLIRHEGKGVDPDRQEAPHVHSTFFSPDKKYILSCDLGLDTVFVYDRALNEVGKATVPAGSGPRHLVFSKDGKYVYVVNEMGASVSTFAYRNAGLTYLDTVRMLPGEERGMGAAIRLSEDGKRLYVTERKTDQIVIFRADGSDLSEMCRHSCHGDGPRDFDLIAHGRYAVAANQLSGNLVLFRVEQDGTLTHLQDEPLKEAISVAEDPSDGR